jgi:hypothetical protein
MITTVLILLIWSIVQVILAFWGLSIIKECDNPKAYDSTRIMLTVSAVVSIIFIANIMCNSICFKDQGSYDINSILYLWIPTICILSGITNIVLQCIIKGNIDECSYNADGYKTALLYAGILPTVFPVLYGFYQFYKWIKMRKHRVYIEKKASKEEKNKQLQDKKTQEERLRLIKEISKWTKRHPSEYNDWSVDELRERIEGIGEEIESQRTKKVLEEAEKTSTKLNLRKLQREKNELDEKVAKTRKELKQELETKVNQDLVKIDRLKRFIIEDMEKQSKISQQMKELGRNIPSRELEKVTITPSILGLSQETKEDKVTSTGKRLRSDVDAIGFMLGSKETNKEEPAMPPSRPLFTRKKF